MKSLGLAIVNFPQAHSLTSFESWLRELIPLNLIYILPTVAKVTYNQVQLFQ